MLGAKHNFGKKLLWVLSIVFFLLVLSSCNKKKSSATTISIAATPVPHADILENAVKKVLKEKGYNLDVIVFNDYVLPNKALEDGEVDANYFQTLGYMDVQNKDAGLHLSPVLGVHIEPMGVYSKKYKALSEIKDGINIGIPNDFDNGLRALKVLAQKGLLRGIGNIEKSSNVNFESISNNQSINPRGFKIIPLEAAALPRSLDDLGIAIINGNFALSSKINNTNPAIAIEEFDEEGAAAKTNFVVVKSGNEDSKKIKLLIEAIESKEVEDYINNKYKGSVIPSFIKPKRNN